MGKIRVKSHVQQERNMSGTAKKFPGPAPEINKPKRATPYVPKLPKDGGGGAGASSSSNGANPFARQLASGDKEVRDAAFAALAKWLNARKDVPMLDMKKIWKGLFYAMWHADGWDVQEELAERVGEAVHAMKHKVALCYLGVFYITARREWIGIDRHRMDKYLRLVRRMTSHALRYCANRDWAEGATSDVSQMFTRAAMAPASAPNAPSERGVVDVGLRLHLAEVFVPELRKVAAGQDYVEVGCDPEKENEGNGGAPITVFRGGKKPTEKKGVPGAFGREKRPDTKSKDKKTKDAKKDLGPKKRDPKPVPPSSVALLLAPFSAVLAVDAHRALHERVVSEVFEAALEGADGGVATRMMDDPASDEDDQLDALDDEPRMDWRAPPKSPAPPPPPPAPPPPGAGASRPPSVVVGGGGGKSARGFGVDLAIDLSKVKGVVSNDESDGLIARGGGGMNEVMNALVARRGGGGGGARPSSAPFTHR